MVMGWGGEKKLSPCSSLGVVYSARRWDVVQTRFNAPSVTSPLMYIVHAICLPCSRRNCQYIESLPPTILVAQIEQSVRRVCVCIHQVSRVNSRNGLAMMTAP